MKQNETHSTCVESTKEIDWTLRNKWLNPALKEGIISYVLNERSLHRACGGRSGGTEDATLLPVRGHSQLRLLHGVLGKT